MERQRGQHAPRSELAGQEHGRVSCQPVLAINATDDTARAPAFWETCFRYTQWLVRMTGCHRWLSGRSGTSWDCKWGNGMRVELMKVDSCGTRVHTLTLSMAHRRLISLVGQLYRGLHLLKQEFKVLHTVEWKTRQLYIRVGLLSDPRHRTSVLGWRRLRAGWLWALK